MNFPKWNVFYSDKEHYLKLCTEMTWHNNLAILFGEVSKSPSSLDLAFKTNSQNKFERLFYVAKYELIYCIIFEKATCQVLLNYSFLLNVVLLQLSLMIFLQFKGMEFISCIQEKYKLSARVNTVFNSFHDLNFPEASSKLPMELTFLSANECR